MKITTLTAAQESKLKVYRDKWIQIGLSCEPCDFEKAKAAASECYRLAGLNPPSIWLLMDSPLSCAIATVILKNTTAQVGAQVRDQVGDQVGAQVGAQVWDQVGAQVGAQVGDQVRAQVRAQVWDQVGAQVGAQVGDQVGDQVWDQVGAQVRDQVGAQVWAQVRDQVRAQVWDQVGAQVFGSHDAGWLSFYDYFRAEAGLAKEADRLSGLISLSQCCGWWAPYSGVCILQHRHAELHRDADGRLHNESGMACRYRDGFGVWAINGIRVDEQIVMRPETQTINQIDAEENGDIRAIRIDRFGWANYLRDSGSRCIDFRDNEVEGTKEALYVTPKNEARLVATCATGRVFAMGVPSQIKSCQSAQEWLAGGKKFRIIGRT